MSGYLTTGNAATTYQQIANIPNNWECIFIKKLANYQPKSNSVLHRLY